jgi:hypothetical protein
MYKVKKHSGDVDLVGHFDTLDKAMQYAKRLDTVVEITTPEYTIVGKFGVDSIEDGIGPDGHPYEWKKRR